LDYETLSAWIHQKPDQAANWSAGQRQQLLTRFHQSHLTQPWGRRGNHRHGKRGQRHPRSRHHAAWRRILTGRDVLQDELVPSVCQYSSAAFTSPTIARAVTVKVPR
jgi:hypothetical protein